MENFEYSVQLSDQDWADFLAATDECGLLQADLASGDELLSSDIDQGDSGGGSPPRAPPLPRHPALGGWGWPGSEKQLPCEPVLAPGAGQQTPSTSAWPGAQRPLSFGPPSQSMFLSEPASSRDEMQRLLQGPPARGPPSPSREPTPCPEDPGCSAATQEQPSRKKRTAGARRGEQAGGPGTGAPRPDSPRLLEARPGQGLCSAGPGASFPAVLLEKGPAGATAEPTARARQDKREPDSAQAPDPGHGSQQEPGLDLSTPVPETEPGTDLVSMTSGAELHAVSTPAWEPQPEVAQSTPISKPKPDMAPGTPSSKPQPEVAPLTPISKLQPNGALSTPNSEPNPVMDLSTLIPMDKPDVDSTAPVSTAILRRAVCCPVSQADAGVHTPGPRVGAAAPAEVGSAAAAMAARGSSPVLSSQGHLEGPRRGQHPGPAQAPRRKKVRFSVVEPGPKRPVSGEAMGPRTAAGGRGGPRAWDAMATGPRTPQPGWAHHQLPPPARSCSRGPRPGSSFALTLPEAYDFLFCDTIEEETEEAEEAAEQALADVQWPDSCEFFFRDCPAPRAATALPGGPAPMSIPEAYEHFFGEQNQACALEPAAESPSAVLLRAGPGLVGRWAGDPQAPRATFTLSQNDMCLVFVAFATWAVRTSDLHTPDAWKTVLLANIGAISAIRHFRRQVEGDAQAPAPAPGAKTHPE